MNPREGNLPAEGAPVNAFVCTISVENIDDTLAKIEAAGGTLATHKMDVPGVGLIAYIGKTKDYYYLYDKKKGNAVIIPSDKVERVDLKNKYYWFWQYPR
jgi:hypothetical protein